MWLSASADAKKRQPRGDNGGCLCRWYSQRDGSHPIGTDHGATNVHTDDGTEADGPSGPLKIVADMETSVGLGWWPFGFATWASINRASLAAFDAAIARSSISGKLPFAFAVATIAATGKRDGVKACAVGPKQTLTLHQRATHQ